MQVRDPNPLFFSLRSSSLLPPSLSNDNNPSACAPTTAPCPHPHSTTMKNQQLHSRLNHSQGSLFVLSTKSTGVIAAISIGLAAAARPYGNRMTGQGLLLSMGALQCCWIGANLVKYQSTFVLDSTRLDFCNMIPSISKYQHPSNLY